MAAVHEQYTREMHEKFGYLACWLPSERLALGDVGRLSDHRFEKITTLAALGVAFSSARESFPAELEYSSPSHVAVSADATVGLSAAAALSALSITFDRAGATFFQAADCVLESVGDLPALESSLLGLCDAGVWRSEYVVVTQVLRTGPTAILVSDQRGARIELRADTEGLTGQLPVARAAGRLSVTARSGLAASVIAPDGATPLFRAVQLRRKLLGRRRLAFRSGDDPVELELAPATWAEQATLH
jgi:hypothetical protein